jgi:hypothetical protein
VLENIIIMYNNMFEFKIHQKQTVMNFSELNKRSEKSVPQNKNDNINTKKMTSYSVQFNNMFVNIQNAKSGCRSCRGTY